MLQSWQIVKQTDKTTRLRHPSSAEVEFRYHPVQVCEVITGRVVCVQFDAEGQLLPTYSRICCKAAQRFATSQI